MFDSEENPENGLRQWKKVSMSWKQNLCICLCGGVKKINGFRITVITFKAYKNVNLQFKNNFKSAELLTKTSFYFILETVLKMTKKTKET